MYRIYRDLVTSDENQESAGLLAFGKKGRLAPNLLRMGFPISFPLLALICFLEVIPRRKDQWRRRWVCTHLHLSILLILINVELCSWRSGSILSS
jgi:hypothetical protein